MAVTVVRTGSVDTSSFLTKASASATYLDKVSASTSYAKTTGDVDFDGNLRIKNSWTASNSLDFYNTDPAQRYSTMYTYDSEADPNTGEFYIDSNPDGFYGKSSIMMAPTNLTLYAYAADSTSTRMITSSTIGFEFANDSNGTLFKIDPSGRTTSPKQPIISGQIGSIASITGAQKIGFDDFWLNQGGISYNATTKRFTVPVAGNYRITMNPFAITGQANTRVLIGKNTDTPTASTHYGHCYRESATYDTMSLNSIVTLAANDYIVFYLYSGGLYNNTSDRFNQFTIELIG